MEKIVVIPGSIRGFGDVVSPKSVGDFDVFDSVLVSGTDTVSGVEMTVYSSSYIQGAVLSKSGDGFVVYTDELSVMPVLVVLKDKLGAVIGGASVQCIVNDDTVLSATTDSSGEATFNIPFISGLSEYKLRFKYDGTSSMGGCSVFGYILVGVPTGLSLTGDKSVVQLGDSVNLVANLMGTDLDGTVVPVAGETVNVYELYEPTLLSLSGDKSVIQVGDNVNLVATLKDSDGSRVTGETVNVYVELPVRRYITVDYTKMVSGYAINGTVVDEWGDSVAGTTVSLSFDGRVVDTALLVDGDFTLLASSVGLYTVSVDGFSVDIEVVEEPIVSGISLTGNKSILSYVDSDTCTLSATVLDSSDNPVVGETVEFFNGATSMGTANTNSSGVATKVYSATGNGNVSFTASVGSIVSETYSINDIYYYDSQTVDKSKITVSKGTGTTTYSSDGLTIHGTGSDESLFLINGLTLPNEYEIEVTALNMQGTGTGILLGDAILIDLDKQQSQLRIYTLQNNSYSEIAKIRNVTYQDTNNVKINVELGALKVYLNDNLITTVNYAPTGSFKYRTYSNDRYTTFKDLKIKAL